MNKFLKNKNGITLIALVITIILLLILSAIGIGTISQIAQNTKQSKATVLQSELSKVQQAVMETYTKYRQLGNERALEGTQMSYADAQTEFDKLGSTDSLKVMSYDGESDVDKALYYYKLDKGDLEDLGLSNINSNDEFIVNYSSGEVFNITQKKTDTGDILYTYARNVESE